MICLFLKCINLLHDFKWVLFTEFLKSTGLTIIRNKSSIMFYFIQYTLKSIATFPAFKSFLVRMVSMVICLCEVSSALAQV